MGTLMFVFLFQFLMKFADRLVGKGLDTLVIIQLIMFNLAWMVVLVVPMAVLVATLMAFGGMSQNNEITIMKSSGISLYRMLFGPFICSIIVAVLLIMFNNDVLPDANHEAKILGQDISQKKPTLSLVPGVFSQEVNNYAILIRQIDQKSNSLTDITIYDYTNPSRINVVTALRGKIYFSKNNSKLLMDLEDGEIHESDVAQTSLYRKIRFQQHRIAMEAEQFSFKQSTPGGQRSDRELSAQDMLIVVDSLSKIKSSMDSSYLRDVGRIVLGDSSAKPFSAQLAQRSLNSKYIQTIERIRENRNLILSSAMRSEFYQNEINMFMVEIHKKYSIPFACLVFILLGAPLGVMIRKGGFGMAASISLFFFLIYWASLIGGEKLADRGIISPFWGMWAANILMGLIGMFLTYRVAKETVHIDLSFLKKLIPKPFRSSEETVNENS
jgi:lipopolysaccharide export system permease protein